MYQLVLVMITAQVIEVPVMMQQNPVSLSASIKHWLRVNVYNGCLASRQPEQWLGVDICTGCLAPG